MEKRIENNLPLVSTVITFYNQKNCVRRAISSVLSQEGEFIKEIVVVDDGSSDGTWELLVDSYSENDEVHLLQQARDNNRKYDPVERASKARLRGLSEASGKYICFLDGDDYFCRADKLRIQCNILECDASLGSCASNFKYATKAGEDLKEGMPGLTRCIKIPFNLYWRTSYLPSSCFLYRAPLESALKAKCVENFDDNTITGLLCNNKPVLLVPEVTFAYVQEQDSTWHMTDKALKALLNLKDFVFEKRYDCTDILSINVRHAINFVELAICSDEDIKKCWDAKKFSSFKNDRNMKQVYSSIESKGCLPFWQRIKMVAASLPYIFLAVLSKAKYRRKILNG